MTKDAIMSIGLLVVISLTVIITILWIAPNKGPTDYHDAYLTTNESTMKIDEYFLNLKDCQEYGIPIVEALKRDGVSATWTCVGS